MFCWSDAVMLFSPCASATPRSTAGGRGGGVVSGRQLHVVCPGLLGPLPAVQLRTPPVGSLWH